MKRVPSPKAAGVLLALVVFALVWGIPARLDAADKMGLLDKLQLMGEVHTVNWPLNSAANRTYAWDINIDIPGDPQSYAFYPALLFNISSTPRGHGIRLSIEVYANEERIAWVNQDTSSGAGMGSRGSPAPDRFTPDPPWREGHNAARVVATLRAAPIDPSAEGSAKVELGPVRLDREYLDTDWDTITDHHQPVPFLPTYVLALLVAAPVGAAGAWGTKKLRAKDSP